MTTEQNPAAPAVREPYDAMGPIDAANTPAARATLATVQPGGRVRLGHHHGGEQAAAAAGHALRVAYRHLDMGSMRVSHCKDAAIIESALEEVRTFDLNAAITALSAQPSPATCKDGLQVQPSPAGQGDALDLDRVLSLADVHAEESREDGVRLLDRGGLLAFAQDVAAALAARQPVGISADWVLGYLTTDAPEDSREAIRNAFTEYAALSGDRQPVGQIVGYTDPEADFLLPRAGGCVLMGKAEVSLFREPIGRYTKPLYDAPPAQAVDPADPWRGLYSPDRMPKLDGVNLYHVAHPDLPSWPNGEDEERGIGPLVTAQGFALEAVFGEYPEDDGKDFIDYCAWLASWTPAAPAGADWRLVCIQDTEDGPAAFYVRPLALIDGKAVGNG